MKAKQMVHADYIYLREQLNIVIQKVIGNKQFDMRKIRDIFDFLMFTQVNTLAWTNSLASVYKKLATLTRDTKK